MLWVCGHIDDNNCLVSYRGMSDKFDEKACAIRLCGMDMASRDAFICPELTY